MKALTILCAVAGFGTVELAAEEAPRPNIIWIMFDDLGYTDTGAFGGKAIPTPNIDRLAEQGTRFTQAYSGAPMCAPARDSLMTGRHTGRTRLRANFVDKNWVIGQERGLRGFIWENDVTVAEALKEAGYATGLSGKWGIAEAGTPGTPNFQGFDEFHGILNQRHADLHYPEWIWHNEERYPLPANRGGRLRQYAADQFANHAVDFIGRHKDKPFFLYLAFCIPHDDFNLPSVAPFEDKPWTHQQKAYARMVADGDERVGRVMKALKDHGLEENTIVFLTSDNGSFARYEGVFDSAGDFAGQKYTLNEGGIRVPTIVRWPGHVPAGTTNDAIWHFQDFFPTAAALTGAEVPQHQVTGTNVLPALLGKDQPVLENRFLYWESTEPQFRRSARKGKWKVVQSTMDEPLRLYDLSQDVGEQNDLAEDHPGIVADFAKRMKEAHRPSPFHHGPEGP